MIRLTVRSPRRLASRQTRYWATGNISQAIHESIGWVAYTVLL